MNLLPLSLPFLMRQQTVHWQQHFHEETERRMLLLLQEHKPGHDKERKGLAGRLDLYFRTTIRKGRLVRKVEAHCPFIDDVNRLMQKEKVCQAVSVSSSML